MVRPSRAIAALEPYKITPQDVWTEAAPKRLLKLDWNEAPENLPFLQDELRRIVAEIGIVAWYPDYLAIELTDELAKYVQLDPTSILTFPGSDVGLETLCRTYLDPDDHAAAVCPTYENFFVYVQQIGSTLHAVNVAKPFRVDVDRLVATCEELPPLKCLYVANPNNPCGYLVELEGLARLASRFPETLVVIDESYIEFTTAASACTLIAHHPNLVVARTFSKAFGLAGMRLGYLCGSPTILNNVNKIRNGKNVSMIAQRLGIHALRNLPSVRKWIAEVRASRDVFEAWLRERGLTHYPSQGNFVMFEVGNPADVCSRLKAQGIYVRNRHAQIPGCIRVSIGSRSHVARLIAELESLGELK